MGKTIVCWSPVHGQAGNTSNTVAMAAVAALEQSFSSLLTHTQFSFSTMEGMFRKRDEQGFDDGGIVALKRLVKSKLLKPDDVPDYTETIYKSRLDFLAGGNFNEDGNEAEIMLNTILRAAQNQYDLLWIDAHSGSANELTTQLLRQADMVLVNLPQNKYIVDQFLTSSIYLNELQDKPFTILVGKYDDKAGYSVRNMKRQHKLKVPVFGIPYETGFRNAANQDSVTEFFFRASKAEKGDTYYPFIQAIREVNGSILKSLELQMEDEWV